MSTQEFKDNIEWSHKIARVSNGYIVSSSSHSDDINNFAVYQINDNLDYNELRSEEKRAFIEVLYDISNDFCPYSKHDKVNINIELERNTETEEI